MRVLLLMLAVSCSPAAAVPAPLTRGERIKQCAASCGPNAPQWSWTTNGGCRCGGQR